MMSRLSGTFISTLGFCCGLVFCHGGGLSQADAIQSLPTPPPVVAPTPSTLPTPLSPPITPDQPDPQVTIEKIRTAAPPYIDRDVGMAPLRPVCSFLGASLQYHDGIITITKAFEANPPGTRTITLRSGGRVAQFQDGNGSRTVNLPRRVEERLGIIYLPLRFLVEALGAELKPSAESELGQIEIGNRIGILVAPFQANYNGANAVRVTIVNNVGGALSLRLAGPQKLAFELGHGARVTRSMRPGVYYYLAACSGMKTVSGARRLRSGQKTTWAWGRR